MTSAVYLYATPVRFVLTAVDDARHLPTCGSSERSAAHVYFRRRPPSPLDYRSMATKVLDHTSLSLLQNSGTVFVRFFISVVFLTLSLSLSLSLPIYLFVCGRLPRAAPRGVVRPDQHRFHQVHQGCRRRANDSSHFDGLARQPRPPSTRAGWLCVALVFCSGCASCCWGAGMGL